MKTASKENRYQPEKYFSGIKKTGKILIVDDDASSRAQLCDMLKDNGHEIIDAPNGKEALKLIDKDRPDLVLSDLTMPEMGGIEICKILKGNKKTKDIPVIIISSKNDENILVRAFETGADDFLVKPVSRVELIPRLRLQLRNRSLSLALEKDKKDLERVLEFSRTLSSTLSVDRILRTIVNKVAQITNASRCSMISIDEKKDLGYVLASNDDPSIHNLKLDLVKYPEIKKVIHTREAVLIDEISSSPILSKVKGLVENFKGESSLIVPVVYKDKVLGTLFIRAKKNNRKFDRREVNFCKIIANASFHALKNATIFSKIQKEKAHLEILSITDQLTDLFNHSYFYLRLDEEFEKAKRYNYPLSCVMMDIDDFKRINDTYGHKKGDEVLTEVARTIKNSIRTHDILARYGGEEFSLILPHSDLKGGIKEAERIRKAVENLTFTDLPKDDHVTISLGVASFPIEVVNNSHDIISCELINNSHDIITCADKALYESKRRGKNKTLGYHHK